MSETFYTVPSVKWVHETDSGRWEAGVPGGRLLVMACSNGSYSGQILLRFFRGGEWCHKEPARFWSLEATKNDLANTYRMAVTGLLVAVKDGELPQGAFARGQKVRYGGRPVTVEKVHVSYDVNRGGEPFFQTEFEVPHSEVEPWHDFALGDRVRHLSAATGVIVDLSQDAACVRCGSNWMSWPLAELRPAPPE